MNPIHPIANGAPQQIPPRYNTCKIPLVAKVLGVALAFFGAFYITSIPKQEAPIPFDAQAQGCSRYQNLVMSHSKDSDEQKVYVCIRKSPSTKTKYFQA
jgi:hypothetical protein